MKLKKQQIIDEIYRQVKKIVFEQVDQPGAEVGPFDKIKQLAELGQKIEQQIQNSLVHLNAFMNIGTKTEDSFEFKRAVAEIGRIQKLTADYTTVITKAHEIAEGSAGEQPQPAQTVKKEVKIDAKKVVASQGPSKPFPKPAPVEEVREPEPDDAEILNKGGRKDIYEGRRNCPECHQSLQKDKMGVLRCYNEQCSLYGLTARVKQPIDSKNESSPGEAIKHPSGRINWKATVQDAFKNGMTYDQIVEKLMQDMSKSRAMDIADEYLINHPPKNEAEDDDAEVINKGGRTDIYESRMGDLAITIDEYSEKLKTKDDKVIAKEIQWDSRKGKLPSSYAKVDPRQMEKFVKDQLSLNEFGIVLQNRLDDSIRTVDVQAPTMKAAAIKIAKANPLYEVKHIVEGKKSSFWTTNNKILQRDLKNYKKIKSTAKPQKEDIPAPMAGDQGSGLTMPPEKHEMQEKVDPNNPICPHCKVKLKNVANNYPVSSYSKCPKCKRKWDLDGNPKSGLEESKIADAEGQSLSVMDHVYDSSWNTKLQKWVLDKSVRYRVTKLISPSEIKIKDMQTKKEMIVDPKDVMKQKKAVSEEEHTNWEGMTEEFDNWTCMECHYHSGKRFKVCPKCGSGEVENLGEAKMKEDNDSYICDRCHRRRRNDGGPFETRNDEYICNKCYQDDVSGAEAHGEGDR